MVFKKMLQAIGVGGPSVDTVLSNPQCRPGELLTGEVRLQGGDADADIEHVALSLVTRVERGQSAGTVEFHRAVVSGRFRLASKESKVIPFQIRLPWEAPITEVFGQRLHGMSLGLRTELAVAKAVDKSDLDPVYIQPTPGQEAVLDAFAKLGFHFKSADLEAGHVYGVRQELPFFQELEFYPPPGFAGRVNEVELTFVANPSGVEVILEADKRGGMFAPSRDAVGRIGVSHEEAVETDWTAAITEWLEHLIESRQSHLTGPGYGQPGYGHPHDGHYGQQRRGPGIGGVVAGAAAGAIGGMIIGDMIGDAFEGDGGGGEDFGEF